MIETKPSLGTANKGQNILLAETGLRPLEYILLSLFKRQIHESPPLQRADLESEFPPELVQKALAGESCDELAAGRGDFGSLSNPIPVNGRTGAIKYLSKLRGNTRMPLMFHRLGELQSPTCPEPVLLFETVCLDGTQWQELCFSLYHPGRSNLAPSGYSLQPLEGKTGQESATAFGVDEFLESFPYSLPATLLKQRADVELSLRISKMLKQHCVVRPVNSPFPKKRPEADECKGKQVSSF